MEITYKTAKTEDIEPIYAFCRQLIQRYERLEAIDYPKVMRWVQRKIEQSISQYTVIYVREQKAGYYHFYQNQDGQYELDDLYIFPEFQNRGIGTEVIRSCCAAVDTPVMLYVFAKNKRAVSLYKRLGFEIAETVNNSRYIMINKKDCTSADA